MPKKEKPQPLKRWSYSAWSLFHRCKYAFYGRYILKVPDKPGYPMLRGIELHSKAEHYLKGSVTKLPKELASFDTHYAQLKKLSPIVEEFWGVTSEWEYTQYDGWCVMKMDAALPPPKPSGVLYLQDLKSGNEYPDHEEQASLYAAIGLAKYPKISGATMEFWYADQGYSTTHEFSRQQLTQLKVLWIERGNDVMAKRTPDQYEPSPSKQACKYCAMRSDKAGDCDAWRTV